MRNEHDRVEVGVTTTLLETLRKSQDLYYTQFLLFSPTYAKSPSYSGHRTNTTSYLSQFNVTLVHTA